MAEVLLIGMGPTALSALNSLATTFLVRGVVRDVDADSAESDPVAQRSQMLDIPLFSDISPAAVEDLVLQLQPDCVVVSSYNRILRPALLECCRFVNVHYAPLPRYRGRANVNWALINDEPTAAITIHTIVPGLDAGNILFQQPIAIGERDTIADLYDKLNAIQREYLAETVRRFLKGYNGTPQHEAEATYGCTRLPEDGEIDWRAPTRQIDCLIRALVAPYPGAYTYLNGQRLMLWRAEPLRNPPNYAGRIPGRVVGRSRAAGYVDVLTGDGILRIFEVQIEHGERCAAAQAITSVRATLGLRSADLLARIQTLESQVAQLRADL